MVLHTIRTIPTIAVTNSLERFFVKLSKSLKTNTYANIMSTSINLNIVNLKTFRKNVRTLKRPSKKRAFNINKKLEDNDSHIIVTIC